METISKAKMIRIAPRKTRLVINLIRGKNVNDALAILKNQDQKAAKVIEKVLSSAIANAINNNKLKIDDLYVKTCMVDEGPVLKRVKMDSRGRTGRNDHKLSHITIILDERQK